MFNKQLMRWVLIIAAALMTGLPAQAGMVGTAQIQSGQLALDLGDIGVKREWIREQLVTGGVGATDATTRVAAMTDAQVLEIHQRMDELPAGGIEGLVIIALILVITELMGYTDIVPGWPSE